MYKTVDYKEQADRRRSRMMYREWCENVFDKIQTRVCARVDARSSEEIEREKHELYKEFLGATNRKVRLSGTAASSACSQLGSGPCAGLVLGFMIDALAGVACVFL